MNPMFLKIMSGILAVLVLVLIFFLYFDKEFFPSFPLKYVNVQEKSNSLDLIESNVVSVKKQVQDWKEKIELFNQNESNEVPSEEIYSDVIIKKMPTSVDYASLLLFIEEQALLHDVIVSNIDLNRETDKPAEPTTEPGAEPATESSTEPTSDSAVELTTEPTTEPEHQNNLAQYGISQQVIYFNVMGDYSKIEEFIQSLSDDMGVYNFIESLELVRGKSEVIDWEKFKDEVQIILPNENSTTEPPTETSTEPTTEPFADEIKADEEINKNIIIKVNMVINYKNGGTN